ncbi:MAG: hypothetical protein FD162_457 [Rhodobacteraceae bacterium]|uniref:DUF4175 domain-containing protein n=1 Tax=Cypionkella sp. TaxID=2811411 RepID=UPI0013298E06|nr:DUF4175 domain-containing protein [Cypionkella sp.]KAF0175486.1 MAG: hypothetical protein FD162_457 [Paracoccaceae bacterium]MDO8328528.1 DUF4175 domain-containing protein [Cypionkella sp.]
MEQGPPINALKRIETPLRITLAGLWAERILRAFWPLWSIAITAIAAASFGLQDALPLEAAWFLMVATVLGLIWALIHGIRSFRRPTRTEALVRLDARLPGQPIAALMDTQAIGITDEASKAVWAAHRSRMAIRAASAKPVEPDLKLASRDPYALRYVALTALVMAMLFGSIWRITTVSGLTPGGTANAAAGPAWEGWAQPPAYTGKPALYLNDQTAEALSLPTGTRLQIRLYGEPGALIVSETVSGRTNVSAASEPAQDFSVTTSGKLAIEGAGGREWQIIATPDQAPSVTPDARINREADGRFKQKFTAKDDYAVTKGQVTIALDLAAVDRRYGLKADPEAIAPVTLDLPLPVKGSRAEIKTSLVDDLSESVLANLPVTITYAVTDAAGQTGAAEPLHLTLPGKRFFDPLADALIEQRRALLWSRSNATTVTQILKAVSNQPQGFITDDAAYTRMRAVIKRLDAGAKTLAPAARDQIAKELWDISLLLEDGKLNDAKARLDRAQERLAEAIRKGASPEEIQQLMDEMRDALNDYMREEAKKAPQDPNDETSPQNQGPSITQDQIQQMLDKLQQLMEEGKTAEAAELMQQLQDLLNNMKVQQGDGQGQGSPGQQSMQDLGDTLRDQQRLSDDAFRDLQDGTETPSPDGKSLSDRQQELRDRLDNLGKDGKLPGQGSEKGKSGQQALNDAGRAMQDAERALREGDLPGALDKQADAMDKMRQGLRDFGDAMAEERRQRGEGQQGDPVETRDPNGTRDPLGRENSARIGSDKNLLQGEDVYRRAQELLDEIRKRSGDQARPEGERNYLKRLLDLF